MGIDIKRVYNLGLNLKCQLDLENKLRLKWI